MEDINTRVKQFSQEVQPLLKKYNLKMGALPDFPLYKQLPIEVQLALKVLEKHEVKYQVAFQEGSKDGVTN